MLSLNVYFTFCFLFPQSWNHGQQNQDDSVLHLFRIDHQKPEEHLQISNGWGFPNGWGQVHPNKTWNPWWLGRSPFFKNDTATDTMNLWIYTWDFYRDNDGFTVLQCIMDMRDNSCGYSWTMSGYWTLMYMEHSWAFQSHGGTPVFMQRDDHFSILLLKPIDLWISR